jgi:hypothetical protein
VERKPVTCPETAHLEEIDLEHTPLGVVVAGCSRFEPRCNVSCARECARRIDARERRDADDREERVLVVYADASWTRPVADALAQELMRDGMIVEQADVGAGAPPPADYDAVVIGAPLRLGRYPRVLCAYVAEHRAELAQIPTFLYVVHHQHTADVARFARDAGWEPTFTIAIERPAWNVRWFGNPVAVRASAVHELAIRVADETAAP